jgi:hypothetical protein
VLRADAHFYTMASDLCECDAVLIQCLRLIVARSDFPTKLYYNSFAVEELVQKAFASAILFLKLCSIDNTRFVNVRLILSTYGPCAVSDLLGSRLFRSGNSK